MTELLYSARDLRKTYGMPDAQVAALKGVSFTIETGEFVAITGPSGSGKSTLLGLLGMLARPTHGDLEFRGTEVVHLEHSKIAALRNAEIGFVFQSFQLMDRTSALENVELPLIYADVPAKERQERARAALERVGLGHRVEHRPAQLSGGEQQRVAIARAMVNCPSVILADEPTGALDTHTGQEVLELLQDLNRQGTSIIIITHNPEIAAGATHRMALVDGALRSVAGHSSYSSMEGQDETT